MAGDKAPGARKVLADEIARPFQEEIQKATRAFSGDARPKLVGFLANEDPAARQYASGQSVHLSATAFCSSDERFRNMSLRKRLRWQIKTQMYMA